MTPNRELAHEALTDIADYILDYKTASLGPCVGIVRKYILGLEADLAAKDNHIKALEEQCKRLAESEERIYKASSEKSCSCSDLKERVEKLEEKVNRHQVGLEYALKVFQEIEARLMGKKGH